MSTCDVCGETWFRGTCSTPRLILGNAGDRQFCYHDEAPYRYWKHIRQSERHQAVLRLHERSMAELLAAVPDTLNRAKVHQKLMRNPDLAPLKELMR